MMARCKTKVPPNSMIHLLLVLAIKKTHANCISSVIVSVLALNVVDHGFESWGREKPNTSTMKFVFVASPLSIQI